MKQSIFKFEDDRPVRREIEASGSIRWIAWNESTGRRSASSSALLVGNRGSIFEYDPDADEFRRVQSGTGANLRCVDFRPDGRVAYACGNEGTLLRIEDGRVTSLGSDSRTTFRRLGWSDDGRYALIVGNDGTAFIMTRTEKTSTVLGADTHLRSIAWRPKHDTAVVTGNCFRDSIGGLTPSPNIFELRGGVLHEVTDLEASRADLISSSWHPSGSSCLVTGFDQTWHTPVLMSYDSGALTDVPWKEEKVFPTACSWNPSGNYALIGSSRLTPSEGSASLYRYEPVHHTISRVDRMDDYGISCIAWRDEKSALIAGSRGTWAYSA